MHFPFSIAAVVAVAGFAVAAPTEFQPMLIGRPMQCLPQGATCQTFGSRDRCCSGNCELPSRNAVTGRCGAK
ncbi:hypothetical protein ACCO45_008977 [Purpureocillium lilacinum]|uniref:Uncharacterized protein n=1 Tax=Purpureocillium lilacinum TaxID=33203 RepID=A0ACC4DIB6_PURLI